MPALRPITLPRIAILAALSFPFNAALAKCDAPQRLQFVHGASAMNISGGIPRGDVDCYVVAARASQTMTIRPPANQRKTNIVFQLYQPGWKITSADEGVEVNGNTLPGAGDGADAQRWTGRLPATGSYLVVIGTSWGGGNYNLTIEIQ